MAPAVVPMVPTVIRAEPSGPKAVSFPSMLPPGLSGPATCETEAGSRWLPCSSACIDTTVWATKTRAMTAMVAYACRGRPMSRPNMKTMATGRTMTMNRSNRFVRPSGFSNG